MKLQNVECVLLDIGKPPLFGSSSSHIALPRAVAAACMRLPSAGQATGRTGIGARALLSRCSNGSPFSRTRDSEQSMRCLPCPL